MKGKMQLIRMQYIISLTVLYGWDTVLLKEHTVLGNSLMTPQVWILQIYL